MQASRWCETTSSGDVGYVVGQGFPVGSDAREGLEQSAEVVESAFPLSQDENANKASAVTGVLQHFAATVARLRATVATRTWALRSGNLHARRC